MEDRRKHYNQLESMYRAAPVNTSVYQNTKVKIDDGQCTLYFEVDDSFHHAAGGLHGSVLFKLLDDAAYFAVASQQTEYFMVTADFHLNFARPFGTGELRAEGKLKFRSKQIWVGEASLYDEKGRLIAWGSGNFLPSKQKLTEVQAYQ